MYGRDGHILVVEDDPDLLSLEAEILSGAGYSVDVAHDGHEALEMAAARLPALVLLDMRMPRMDGWQFAKAFRERHGASCPIVVVTAAENARRRAEEVGAAGFLEKPFDIDEVLREVERHLGSPPVSSPVP
ncbi:MAG TPA: response regulator [Anaeromyxobacteraceae bacterium]|nr:response regulator [Anaeromyxobacteraceae bacterium]